jgi:hypothetical protein
LARGNRAIQRDEYEVALRRKVVDAYRGDGGGELDIHDVDEQVPASQVTLPVETGRRTPPTDGPTRVPRRALVGVLTRSGPRLPRHQRHDVHLLKWPEPSPLHRTKAPLVRYQVTAASEPVKRHPYTGWTKSF